MSGSLLASSLPCVVCSLSLLCIVLLFYVQTLLMCALQVRAVGRAWLRWNRHGSAVDGLRHWTVAAQTRQCFTRIVLHLVSLPGDEATEVRKRRTHASFDGQTTAHDSFSIHKVAEA